MMGLFTAVFMRKRLTHMLRIEYPSRFDTKLEIETVKLSSVRAVSTQRQSYLSAALTHAADHRGPVRGVGICYTLEDSSVLESGIYSTAEDEINDVVAAVATFLELSPSSDKKS